MSPLAVLLSILFYVGSSIAAIAQDTTLSIDKKVVTLPEAIVRTHFDYKTLLKRIQDDTSFYKAFKNLHQLSFTSYNDIQLFDKHDLVKASLFSKTQQKHQNSCRSMQTIEEKTTGDFYDNQHAYRYTTAQLYASLFFTKGTICGETNIVNGSNFSTNNKKGIDQHKEQLKMLFFQPGKKIPAIPFIGNKLDVFDDAAANIYDYKLDIETYNGKLCYIFSISPKSSLGFFKRKEIVVDEMTTKFDLQTLEVLYRKYSLSYHAGVYAFNVAMEVEMTKFNDWLVPKVLRYKGNWNVLFSKHENGAFTATMFDFSKD